MANDNRYNEEKENATFAVNLRKLFEDKKATHNELACFIKEKTGDSITRQAVGQWCNGNSSPNLKTVPVIAEFFGVSSDYLLGMSDVKSTNVDVKTMCEMTGLTDKAVETLLFGEQINYSWWLKAINFLLEDLHDDFKTMLSFFENIEPEKTESTHKERQPSSQLLMNLVYYLNTLPAKEKGVAACDEIMISQSGKIIDENTDFFSKKNVKLEDIVSIKTVKKSEIINKILYDDVCASAVKAKEYFMKKYAKEVD